MYRDTIRTYSPSPFTLQCRIFFALATNPSSLIPGGFMYVQAAILAEAEVTVAPVCPMLERSAYLPEKVSTHSAREQIKQACSRISLDKLWQEVMANHPQHLHLLPSILTPEMPYPLIGIIQSVPDHRLAN